MKCIYISENLIQYKREKKEIITALVIDEENRLAFKQSINDLFEQCFGSDYRFYPIYWDDIDEENVAAYCHVIRLFNINPNISVFSYTIPRSNVAKKRAAQLKLINEIKEFYHDDIKIFIPAKENGKKIIKNFTADLKDIDIDCVISQNPLEESRFYQVSQLLTDILVYFDDDLKYFDNIDKPGKPQLVNYYLDMKKTKNKINTCVIQ